MAAHRYWRLWIINTGSPWAGFAEIELRTSAGGPDRTVPGGGVSASVFYPGWPPSQTVDNDINTGWTTFLQPEPYWWAYDFGPGAAYDIVELYLTPRQDGFEEEAPIRFEWQYSDDGVTWLLRREVLGLTWTTAAQAIDVSPAAGEDDNRFRVEPVPLVRWRATVPVNQWIVEPTPRVVWNGELADPFDRFTVHTAPVVKWNTGTGAATTECIGGEGEIPPPDDPPPASTEENYVF